MALDSATWNIALNGLECKASCVVTFCYTGFLCSIRDWPGDYSNKVSCELLIYYLYYTTYMYYSQDPEWWAEPQHKPREPYWWCGYINSHTYIILFNAFHVHNGSDEILSKAHEHDFTLHFEGWLSKVCKVLHWKTMTPLPEYKDCNFRAKELKGSITVIMLEYPYGKWTEKGMGIMFIEICTRLGIWDFTLD